MIWGDFKTYVKNKVQYDGESSVDLSSIIVGSLFDTRANIYLKMYTKAVEQFFSPKIVLTTTATLIQDLLTATPAATVVFKVWKVWLGNNEIPRRSADEIGQFANLATASTGTPTTWGMTRDYALMFDKPCTAGLANSFVGGWYVHPTLGNDNTALSLPDDQADFAACYCALMFQEGVVSDSVGVGRMQHYDLKTYHAMNLILAANKKMFHQTWNPGF